MINTTLEINVQEDWDDNTILDTDMLLLQEI